MSTPPRRKPHILLILPLDRSDGSLEDAACESLQLLERAAGCCHLSVAKHDSLSVSSLLMLRLLPQSGWMGAALMYLSSKKKAFCNLFFGH